MLILAILVFGLFVGSLAQLALGHKETRNYAQDLIVGLAGSFVGGLIVSLLAGDGLKLRPSGIIGSVLGAMILLVVMDAVERRRRPAKPAGKPAKRRP
jgi:uncharacterized membrane protein YeaQ/YmgE (transglycosylase-associated protein family)